MNRFTRMDVKLVWGNSNYQFVSSDSIGNSGGILCVWEAFVFKKDYATISDNFIAIYGTWNSNNSKVLIMVIYAPQSLALKRVLWDYISSLIMRWNDETIVMGDFNEVQSVDERLGSSFNRSSARFFNHFITASGLVDVKMEGYSFTWSHPSTTKMSKLDRFLVSEEILTDFGPTPFRFYHSWFKWDGFDTMVEHAWNSFSHSDSNRLVWLKKKLQDLKKIIRTWVKDKKSQQFGVCNSIKDELLVIDKELDSGNVSDELLFRRMGLMRQYDDIKQMESKEFIQKSKIKWAIEGDENSKFFHGIINRKHSQLSIRGVFVDGDWNTDPVVVKDAFKDHFASRFKFPVRDRLKLNIPFPNRLSTDQVADLDGGRYWRFIGPDFCSAVECFFESGSFPKGCNSSFIALIPKVIDAKFVSDYRPISLVGCVYKVVTKILVNRLAMVIKDLVSDTQSAFVANRQILDGPFILNEILAWCKRKKKQALIFKADFAKAYDSIRWDYLLDVLQAFGFGPKWCKWIRGIFSSAMASVLVNGSPSSEFPFFCGLKQGDPLAPFLFILVMESLHISISRTITDGVFEGIQLHGSLCISHLFYADDTVFIGEWSESNLENLVRILHCFFLASGLKINFQKSQLLGVGVPRNLVIQGASLIGCDIMQSPFKYLGVMVGEYPSKRKIAWVAWDRILASKKNGGLGVSSFHALNRALLLKWVWRFISQDGSLWYRVIQAMYGPSVELHLVNHPSNWCSILREMQGLSSKGFNLISHCKKRVGDGHNTRFWVDPWFYDQPLCNRFPRIFALEMDKDVSVASKLGAPSIDASFRRLVRDGVERQQWIDLSSASYSVTLSSSKDRWVCDLNGDGEFRVKEIRKILDDIFLPSVADGTRWVKHVPIKINVFAWRARLDRLPTRNNLASRGVDLDSYVCPLCGLVPEDIQHVLFR
ncbi:RNA-directed DNA polymerase, eukaryota, partial [Tanacetum coccineum]